MEKFSCKFGELKHHNSKIFDISKENMTQKWFYKMFTKTVKKKEYRSFWPFQKISLENSIVFYYLSVKRFRLANIIKSYICYQICFLINAIY